MESSSDNFQTSIENSERGGKTNEPRKLDANNRYGNAPFRLQDKHSEFLRTLADVEGEVNSSPLELPTASVSPDSESTNLAVENSLSLETALATDAIAQGDMSALRAQDQMLNKHSQTYLSPTGPMGTAQLTKDALEQASSENDLPTKLAMANPPETSAPKSESPVEAPIILLDDIQKVVPERTSPLGLLNHASSAAVAKTVSTQLPITQSSIEYPAVQTVARTLAQVQETQSGISVRLNPPEMGRVFIDFQFNADRSVTAIIRSEVPETAVLLKHNADFLQDALKDSGFNSITLSFEQNDRSKHEGFNFDQKNGSPVLYQSAPSDNQDQSDTSETIHRHQMSTNSAIDLKL